MFSDQILKKINEHHTLRTKQQRDASLLTKIETLIGGVLTYTLKTENLGFSKEQIQFCVENKKILSEKIYSSMILKDFFIILATITVKEAYKSYFQDETEIDEELLDHTQILSVPEHQLTYVFEKKFLRYVFVQCIKCIGSELIGKCKCN